MKKVVMSGPISVERFEFNFKVKTRIKTGSSLTTADSFVGKIDKEKRRFVLSKTGGVGIGGGQLYFYGRYDQHGDETTVTGKFDMSKSQKIVLYVAFTAMLLLFLSLARWKVVYNVIAISLFHLYLFSFYLALREISYEAFKQRGDATIALLKEMLQKS